jgi:ribonuclease I
MLTPEALCARALAGLARHQWQHEGQCTFVLVTQYKSTNTHAALAGDIEMAKRWFHQVLLLS